MLSAPALQRWRSEPPIRLKQWRPRADSADVPAMDAGRKQVMPAEFITQAPRDTAGWVAQFDHAALPVLAGTALALDELRANQDAVDAHLLAETLCEDPLMTVKLLAHVAQLRSCRRSAGEDSDTETVTEALVMLGIPPFFTAFDAPPTVEQTLADHPDALAGFERVLRRSRRASRFAMGFAVHRMDHDAGVLHEAALLHGVAELLLWLRAPALALQIERRLHADPQLRSSTVQRTLLNSSLDELVQALMIAWRLPRLLLQISDAHAAQPNAQMRNVQLAIRVARHSAQGWDNAALPDDVHDVGVLLNLAPSAAERLLRDIDDETA